MQWILLVLGAVFGYMAYHSFSLAFLCALLAGFIGLNIRVTKLTKIQQVLLIKIQRLEKDSFKNKSADTHTPLETDKPEIRAEHANITQEIIEQPLVPQYKSVEPIAVFESIVLPVKSTDSSSLPSVNEHPIGAIVSTKKAPEISSTQDKNNKSNIMQFFYFARDWLLEGNVILKVGAIILFLGMAFLLRYATEGLTFPIEGRYIAVAIAGLVLITFGWLLRDKKQGYGLILQGMGIAILYLTSYAAMYLHHLLSPQLVFIFLLTFTISATLLAIYQDAVTLACAAALGGFAAPILVSSGGGSHIVFFSYLLILNAGILSLAWFKAWRPLNLIGFVGTLGVGFAWGVKSYSSPLFWSTEPFLIAFFLLYVVVGLLFARRKLYEQKHLPKECVSLLKWSVQQTNYLDATIVFGTPIVSFGLQCTLIQHIEYGVAVSALLLGIFYLIQAFLFYQFGSRRSVLLTETTLALGVVFTTLSIPLAFSLEWTSASWALEGVGVFWISLRQRRYIGVLFSTLLQCGAVISFISQLSTGGSTSLLVGSSFGSLLLAVSLLLSFFLLLKNHEEVFLKEKEKLLALFAILGVGSFYLLAPLSLMQQGTAICWAFMGLLTLMVSRYINYSILFSCGLVIQFLAVILFILKIPFMSLGLEFAGNLYQFVMCFIFALLLLVNGIFVNQQKSLQVKRHLSRLNILLLVGLVIIHLAPLFILSWLWCVCIWVVMASILTALNRRLQSISIFYFSLALLIIAIIVFLIKNTLMYKMVNIFNINFITLLVICVATLVMAWHIKQVRITGIFKNRLQYISNLLLAGGLVCWSIAFVVEVDTFVINQYQATMFLFVVTVTAFIIGLLARYYQWDELALLQLLLTPIAFIILNQVFFDPLSYFAWFAWACLIAVHFFNLKHLSNLILYKGLLFCHVTGVWLIIALLSCMLAKVFKMMSLVNMTWDWIVWMIIPCLWLIILYYRSSFSWPIKDFKKAYFYIASLPIAIYLFAWFWLANILSAGAMTKIPYIPIINPLEVCLIAVLFANFNWLKQAQSFFPVRLPSYFMKSLIGISLFVMSTMLIFRVAFNWFSIPFNFEDQIHSMTVQAGLSILWTITALGLMIRGHQKSYRELWIIGASLIVLVVVKLFFVELRNSDSLARIISFTIVGVLLLIVGYFAPLPPKTQKEKELNK